MEIRLLLVADFANVDTAGKLNIIGAFNQISPNQFPYRHPLMYVVFRIGATLGEFHRERTFKVVLRNEDAQEQWTTPDMAFQIPPPEGGRTAEFNAVIGIQGLTFETPGRYEFAVFIDQDVRADIALDILLREQP